MRGDVVRPRAASAVGQVAQGLIPAVRGNVIDGAAIAGRVLAEVRTEVERLKAAGVVPGLSVVLVGDDPASAVYVGSKERTCKELGMNGETIRLPATATECALATASLNSTPIFRSPSQFFGAVFFGGGTSVRVTLARTFF